MAFLCAQKCRDSGGKTAVFFSVICVSRRSGVFFHAEDNGRSRAVKPPKTTLFKTKGRRCGNGGISHRQDARLHGHVKSSSAQHGIIPESERASVAHAVIAGQLGLHHKGTCPYLQGRCGQYLCRCAGAGGTRVCDPRARPRSKRSARLD